MVYLVSGLFSYNIFTKWTFWQVAFFDKWPIWQMAFLSNIEITVYQRASLVIGNFSNGLITGVPTFSWKPGKLVNPAKPALLATNLRNA